jgi:hypothetical protein
MDDDLLTLTRDELIAEARRLRAAFGHIATAAHYCRVHRLKAEMLAQSRSAKVPLRSKNPAVPSAPWQALAGLGLKKGSNNG